MDITSVTSVTAAHPEQSSGGGLPPTYSCALTVDGDLPVDDGEPGDTNSLSKSGSSESMGSDADKEMEGDKCSDHEEARDEEEVQTGDDASHHAATNTQEPTQSTRLSSRIVILKAKKYRQSFKDRTKKTKKCRPFSLKQPDRQRKNGAASTSNVEDDMSHSNDDEPEQVGTLLGKRKRDEQDDVHKVFKRGPTEFPDPKPIDVVDSTYQLVSHLEIKLEDLGEYPLLLPEMPQVISRLLKNSMAIH